MQRLGLLLSCVVFLASVAAAQTGAGAIQGVVTDNTGAVVAGAQVTAVQTSTNVSRSTVTSDSGVYAFPVLPVGEYAVTIAKEGFATFKTNFLVTVSATTPGNAALQVGSVSNTLTVEGDQLAPIETESSQISNLLDTRTIKDLPLLTRNPYQLALLSPGTSTSTSLSGGVSVNGQRDRNNNFLLDGVDNNDTSVPGILGGVLSANPESTEEFRIITNSFSAEYGRNTGAIVDVVTKSGSNDFHGNAYWFGRWNSFGGARDWFNHNTDPVTGDVEKQNPYVRNQFGYSIGGPIIKNKTFFFFNNEFQRFRTTLTGAATVPTQGFKNGVFTWHTTDANGNPVDVPIDLRPSSSQNLNGMPADPTMQNVFALYPNPTILNGDGYSGVAFFPSSSAQDSYQTVFKLDHHLTQKHTLSARYGYDYFKDPNPSHSNIFPGDVGAIGLKAITQGVSATLNSALTNTLLNSFTFGWNKIYAPFTCEGRNVLDNPNVNVVDQYGAGREYIMDTFTSFACGGGGFLSNSQTRTTGTTSYGDSLSWVHGSHSFKFGSDFRNVRESGFDNFFSRRQVDLRANTIGFGGLLLGVDNSLTGFNVLEDDASAFWGFAANDFYAEFFNKGQVRQPTDNKNFRQHEYDFYVQDSWKAMRNLTLNLGIRYQFNGVPYEEDSNFSNLFQDPASAPLTFSLVGPGTGRLLYNNDFSNVEPRIGFSFDPKGDGKTAIRGAYGIFHDRVFGNLFGNARSNPPFEADYQNFPGETINNFFGSGAFPVIPPMTNPTPTLQDGDLALPSIFDDHFRNPQTQSWNLGIQRELPGQWVLDVTYVGNKGTYIPRIVEANPPDPTLVNQLVANCDATPGCNSNFIAGSALWRIGGVEHNATGRGAAVVRAVGNASYNGLQTKVTHRFSHGLQVQGSYTYAHAIDDSSDPLQPGNLGGNPGFPRDSRHLQFDRGNSDDDVRHVGTVSYIYELPFGRGRGMASEGLVGRVLEGFQISGLVSAQTGHPFTMLSGVDTFRTGRIGYTDLVGDPYAQGPNNGQPGVKTWITNLDALNIPAFGTIGNAGKNKFYGPAYVDFDMSVAKKMKITERVGLELRFEGYNIFNHPNFLNPGTDPAHVTNILASGAAGLITSTVTNGDGTTSARQMQVGMKLTF
jgi:outer membrane receptor protein involved in Fe transport